MLGLQFRFLHVPEAPEGLKAIPHSGFVDIQKTMIPQRRCYIANVTRQQTPRQVTYRRKSARTSIATRARLRQKQASAGTRLCQNCVETHSGWALDFCLSERQTPQVIVFSRSRQNEESL